MIWGVVSAYNEERMLPGCLESMREQVDRLVVVDGAYEHFPHQVWWSTDRTHAIALAFGARWIGALARPWADEIEKRNRYLIGNEGDWYVMLDADERLRGTLPELESGLYYALQIVNYGGHTVWPLRIFQQRGQTFYRGAHHAIWVDGQLLRPEHAVRLDPAVCR